MSARKVALWVLVVIIGIPILMFLWSLAGSLVSTPNDFAVIAGAVIYAAIIATVVFIGIRVYNWFNQKSSADASGKPTVH